VHEAVVGDRMMLVLNSEKAPSPISLPGDRGGLLYADARCTDMQMVEADAGSVEARLLAGQIACVGCGDELRPWGFARWRTLRDHDTVRGWLRRCGERAQPSPSRALKGGGRLIWEELDRHTRSTDHRPAVRL
jgi:hypothetical protein